MRRRELLKAGVWGWGAGLVDPARLLPAQASPDPADSGLDKGEERQYSISIREYLSREALKVSANSLADYSDAEALRRLVPERRRQFWEMMGLPEFPPPEKRPPLNVKVTGVIDRPQYRIEKLYYESVPKLYVDANLYVPKNLKGQAPAVLYVCGHEVHQKVTYQGHARKFAELGFVCLLIETLYRGEVLGDHDGPRVGKFHWYSRGYTSGGMEMVNGIRGIDLLVERPEVDAERIGVTGMSGGGMYSWYIPAADERPKIAAAVCGTASVASHIANRAVDRNCDCMWWVNTYGWDQAGMGALIAPRPFLVISSRLDQYFVIQGARDVYRQLKGLYTTLGVADHLNWQESPGEHGYDKVSRTTVFSWFLKHLQGKNVSPEEVGDIDQVPEHQESWDTLRVFVNGPPLDDDVPTIHDDRFVPPDLPQTSSSAIIAEERRQVVEKLRAKTFRGFPQIAPPLDVKVEYDYEFWEDGAGYRFSFTSEEGWRLHGYLVSLPKTTPRPAPAIVGLRNPGAPMGLFGEDQFLGRESPQPVARIFIEPRGTGDTAWGEELNMHVRRASAWSGRTLASMRVYDTLRGLQAVRQLAFVDAKQVALAAQGEMAAVALYAALLDGNLRALILDSPPATQNAPSERDGRGPAIEMLNCLRITDLAQISGLLYPLEQVFLGQLPLTYAWVEEIYNRLGPPGKLLKLRDLSGWQPS
ncbi:MAG: acetylxylan esterase [Terriglobia bacterium]